MDKNMKNYTLRVKSELLKKFAYISDYESRTINRQLEILMKRAIQKFERDHGEIPTTKSKKESNDE